MVTQQAQIKINLPLALKEFIESKAQRLGVPIAVYVKHLIMKEVEHMDYPVYQASKKAEEAYKLALKEKKTGKLIKINDVNKFFEEL